MSHDFVERLFSQRDPDGSKHFLKVVAPMVRYSKMPFRLLCYQWGADLCFTPMIIAEGFNKSEKARDSSFRSCSMDRPLVVQFAANDPVHFGLAARRVAPFADAVDLNCGCPQKWAMAEGMGASLVKQPQLIKEMVQAARNMSGLPTSIKIRVEDDRRRTVDLIRMVESAGVAWITVHGRTAKEFTKVPVHLDAIKLAKENASVPIIANGDCFMPSDVLKIQSETGADGIFSEFWTFENFDFSFYLTRRLIRRHVCSWNFIQSRIIRWL
jgi:tRNA-dihydrouridine synthase 4